MFHKALWMRNNKLAASAVWALYIILFFLLPFTFYGDAQNVKSNMEQFSDYSMHFNFSGAQISLFLICIVVGMAALLIGQERTTHSTDLTFAMPFSRKDIFLSKWLFGTAHIVTSLLVNILLSMLVLKFTILSEVTDLTFMLKFTSFVVPISLAIFTFSMLIGTIAGSIISQFILSVIFLMFPIGFLTLVGSFFAYHGFLQDPMRRLDGSLNWLGHMAQIVTLPISIIDFSYFVDQSPDMVGDYLNIPSNFAILSALIYLLLSLPLGVWLFSRTKNENNGKLLVFDRGKRFFIFGVVLCFTLFGGMFGGEIFGSYSRPSLMGYYFSAAVGGVLSYFILTKLINIQLKWNR